jgi:hypothetical protein
MDCVFFLQVEVEEKLAEGRKKVEEELKEAFQTQKFSRRPKKKKKK